jgi:hypothetical protein
MWWGAERIWQDEVVRLAKLRGQISLPGVEPADPKSKNAAVFLKIRLVFRKTNLLVRMLLTVCLQLHLGSTVARHP